MNSADTFALVMAILAGAVFVAIIIFKLINPEADIPAATEQPTPVQRPRPAPTPQNREAIVAQIRDLQHNAMQSIENMNAAWLATPFGRNIERHVRVAFAPIDEAVLASLTAKEIVGFCFLPGGSLGVVGGTPQRLLGIVPSEVASLIAAEVQEGRLWLGSCCMGLFDPDLKKMLVWTLAFRPGPNWQSELDKAFAPVQTQATTSSLLLAVEEETEAKLRQKP